MSEPAGRPIYQINIQGHLDRGWMQWFADLLLSYDNDGNTILTGPVADQSELLGILVRLADLNLTLVSVIRKDACLDWWASAGGHPSEVKGASTDGGRRSGIQ